MCKMRARVEGYELCVMLKSDTKKEQGLPGGLLPYVKRQWSIMDTGLGDMQVKNPPPPCQINAVN